MKEMTSDPLTKNDYAVLKELELFPTNKTEFRDFEEKDAMGNDLVTLGTSTGCNLNRLWIFFKGVIFEKFHSPKSGGHHFSRKDLIRNVADIEKFLTGETPFYRMQLSGLGICDFVASRENLLFARINHERLGPVNLIIPTSGVGLRFQFSSNINAKTLPSAYELVD